MTSGGGGDDIWQPSESGSNEEVVPYDAEPWVVWEIEQENKKRRLLREFPDLEEEDNPFAVWDWTVPKRRRIIRKAREQIENEKEACALAQVAKTLPNWMRIYVAQ